MEIPRGVAQRIAAMRPAGAGGEELAALLLRFGRDVILLLKDLAKDPRVPLGGKITAGVAVAYLVSPLDVIPDNVLGIGQLDDLGIMVLALRKLLTAAGHDVINQLWRGSDEGLALVLTLAGVED